MSLSLLSFKNPGDIGASGGFNSSLESGCSSFAAFVGEDALPKFLMRLLTFVDIFAIWIIASVLSAMRLSHAN